MPKQQIEFSLESYAKLWQQAGDIIDAVRQGECSEQQEKEFYKILAWLEMHYPELSSRIRLVPNPFLHSSVAEPLKGAIDLVHQSPTLVYASEEEISQILSGWQAGALFLRVALHKQHKRVVGKSSELVKVEEPLPALERDEADDGVVIVHLSDLHFGPQHINLVDAKIGRGELVKFFRKEIFDEFLSFLSNLPADQKPTFAVVTGDLTSYGLLQPMRTAFENLNKLFLREYSYVRQCPYEYFGKDRVIVVPGNHDVPRDGDDRFAMFADVASSYDYNTPFRAAYRSDRKYSRQPTPPLLVYPEYRLLFYCFTSAGLAPAEWSPISEVADFFRRRRSDLLELLSNAEESGEVTYSEYFGALEELEYTDLALVGSDALRRFEEQLPQGSYPGYTKIALIHHHVSPIPFTEIKPFEAVIDAGELKRTLTSRGFDLVLHGHKHLHFITYENLLSPQRSKGIYIVGAGTLGGLVPTEPNSFNLIRIHKQGNVLAEVTNVAYRIGRGFQPEQPITLFRRGDQ